MGKEKLLPQSYKEYRRPHKGPFSLLKAAEEATKKYVKKATEKFKAPKK